MKDREYAMNKTSQRHEWYLERQRRKSPVEYKTVHGRLNRQSDMLRWGRTLDEIYIQPSWTKLVYSKNSKKLHWQKYPELWKEWNKQHHPSVHWVLARSRYYDWWNIIDSCNEEKILNKPRKKRAIIRRHPELWEMWNKYHHWSVQWKLARERYYNWRDMYDACHRARLWVNLSNELLWS